MVNLKGLMNDSFNPSRIISLSYGYLELRESYGIHWEYDRIQLVLFGLSPWVDEVEAVEFAIKSLALLRRDATWWKDAAEVCNFCELDNSCLWNVLVLIGKSPIHSSTTLWNRIITIQHIIQQWQH